MAVFCNDELRCSRLVIWIVIFASEKEHHKIGVLLDAIVYNEVIYHKIMHMVNRCIVNIFFREFSDRKYFIPINVTQVARKPYSVSCLMGFVVCLSFFFLVGLVCVGFFGLFCFC